MSALGTQIASPQAQPCCHAIFYALFSSQEEQIWGGMGRYLCHCVGLMEFIRVEKGVSWKSFTHILSRHIFFFEALNTKEN